MNTEEVCEIKKTWEIPMQNPIDSGAAILICFFTKYPYNMEKFASFRDTPVTELNNNPRFRAHCGNIIRTFNESINSLGDDGYDSKLKEIWSKIARTHFPRKIEKKAYNELKETILEVLPAICKMNEKQTAAWIKLVDYVYTILFSTVDNLAAK